MPRRVARSWRRGRARLKSSFGGTVTAMLWFIRCSRTSRLRMLNEPGQTAGAGDCDNAPRVHWRLAGEAPSGVVWPSVSERSLAAIENNSHRALRGHRSEEHTSELQSLMRISYAVFCLKKTKAVTNTISPLYTHATQRAITNHTPM